MYMHLKVYEMYCNVFNDRAYYLYQMENLVFALNFFSLISPTMFL